jgi:hypothetical protein
VLYQVSYRPLPVLFILYNEALLHETVTVTKGYYVSDFNDKPVISQAIIVGHRIDPNQNCSLNPPLVFCFSVV